MRTQPATLLRPEKAEALAKKLKESDPEWDYRVKHAPDGKGFSRIEVYDENAEFVGEI